MTSSTRPSGIAARRSLSSHTTATSAREVAEWKRYESALNVAWASTPASVVCPYDANELPEDIVSDATRTHPVLRRGRGSRPSPSYTDPEVFVRDLGLELSDILAGAP